MKTSLVIFIVAVAGLVALSSCHKFKKRGNGHITTEERAVTPFTKISIDGLFPVELSQDGGAELVKVEADQNLQSMISVKVEGNELIIKTSTDSSISNPSKMKVYINIRKINELNFNAVGSMITKGVIKLDSLNVNSESVGKLSLNLDADFLRANLNSVGSTVLAGKVREVRINNKSVGALSAFDLKAGTMMIHNTSIGLTEVYADSAFYIRSSSVGVLYYKGPGQIKELKSEGIGRVQKKD